MRISFLGAAREVTGDRELFSVVGTAEQAAVVLTNVHGGRPPDRTGVVAKPGAEGGA